MLNHRIVKILYPTSRLFTCNWLLIVPVMNCKLSQSCVKCTRFNLGMVTCASLTFSPWCDHEILTGLVVVFRDVQNDEAFWCDNVLVESHRQSLICGSYFLTASCQF
jgi:hypothetical protein